MDVFGIRERLVEDYKSFTTSFVEPRDERIREHLDQRLGSGEQWPDPWLSLNPFFASGGTISELAADGVLHPDCARIFRIKDTIMDQGDRELTLHKHQRDAIQVAGQGEGYVLTTGTGSGKSLAYIVPIVDRVLREKQANPSAGKSVKAIVVYPTNALANSQLGELRKFLTHGFGEGKELVTYARYTGQEKDEERQRIMASPPDILLTNYVMLDLLLTRPAERQKLIRAARGLQFLVLDELHTYRGRQGADVAMLVRRLREACQSPRLQCVGTSATMASGGSRQDQRIAVADVASRLFGAPVTAERVIGETLIRGTSAQLPDAASLRGAMASKPHTDFAGLADSPLAAWVETMFGLATDPDSGDLVRQRPTKVDHASVQLAQQTDESVASCAEAIRATLRAGSRARHPVTDRPLFAFRLHQFLSKGDNVYCSIEATLSRHITSRYQIAVPHQPAKVLVPLSFCRECGQEYLSVVREQVDGDHVMRPRSDRDSSGESGYLYIADDLPWPQPTELALLVERLPESWLTTDKGGQVVTETSRRKQTPRAVRVMPDGTETESAARGIAVADEVETGDGVRAAFVPSPFRFCLRCGTSYEQRGNEFARLATLSAEGRSSAVTVLSTSVVRSLKAVTDPDFDDKARKLLTFVDNRQDASLQSGHVNDFVQVSQLRAALAKAVSDAGPDGLASSEIGQKVADALQLKFADFSNDLDPAPRIRAAREEVFRDLLSYRLFADLERGWRINMPNLEQVGLLVIEYVDLSWLAEADERWSASHHALRDANAAQRAQLLRVLLDELRRALALESPRFTEPHFEQLRIKAANNLREPWSMEYDEKMTMVKTAYARGASGGHGTSPWVLNLSGRGAFGAYIRKRSDIAKSASVALNLNDAQEIIADLLAIACTGGLLRDHSDEADVPGYRLNIDVLRWKPGSGQRGIDDVLRRNIKDDSGPRVNPFFRDLYQRGSEGLTGILAREHTAQVPAAVRQEREDEFREGRLPMLFCSPTMELGVDIASLNAVAMRNVPPTPANYAQRSGRAGRQGQPALVITYCATGNSHDSYYFARSDQMVAGSVAAPRLDLGNEDLVRSHLRAIWLAETDADLSNSMAHVLDVDSDNPSLVIREDLRSKFANESAINRAIDQAQLVVAGIRAELESTLWFDQGWVARTVAQAPAAFDSACGRWRELYRSAIEQQVENNKIVNDGSASRPAQDSAKRRRADAESQLRILRNDESERSQTDFYPYRYFASEGFLPGYSFPRLPLAAFIPGRQLRTGSGSYLQRPRFLAVNEFGPAALIYHEGARYQVDRVQLPAGDPSSPGSIDTTSMRRCEACGYLHDREELVDDCRHCGEALGATTEGLIALRTVFTRRRERISSDEEERRRAGFEMQLSYRFADRGTRPGHADSTVVAADGSPLLTLSYGDAATVRLTNLGMRRRSAKTPDGFYVDTTSGKWLSDATDRTTGTPMSELDDEGRVKTKARVIPFVEDTRNIVVTRIAQPVDPVVATTLHYALERGIEAEFQLEDSELASQKLPDDASQGRALFMEVNEGGAGVLRRVVDEPGALALVARRALEICHFDADGNDLLAEADDDERCEKACYHCVLAYSNQLDHPMIDRHAVRELLVALASSTTTRDESAHGSDHLAALLARCENTLETGFIEYLVAHDHRLPTGAQLAVSDARARPDFVYQAANGAVAVFLDGPVHDDAHTAKRDQQARTRLADLGWFVVAIRYDEDLPTRLAEYPSVFGKGR